MVDHSGEQLGSYRLLRLLGRGSFGQVYLGEHIYLGMHAAVKLLLEDVHEAEAEAFRTAFLMEARRIAVLKHPHILRLLEFGMEASTPYLVMEYAAHGTVLSRHARGVKVPVDQVVGYTKQIAQALDYAHEARLIHRDVKPANVLLDERDTVLLGDFGIATVAHHTSSMQTAAYAGTAAYMAPEQLQGKPIPASDQYALAIMVYEWLCGQLPYQGDPIAIGMQHLTVPVPPLRMHNDALSPDIEEVVLQALSKDPRQRFRNVQAFATALEQASRIVLPQSGVSAKTSMPPGQPTVLSMGTAFPEVAPRLPGDQPSVPPMSMTFPEVVLKLPGDQPSVPPMSTTFPEVAPKLPGDQPTVLSMSTTFPEVAPRLPADAANAPTQMASRSSSADWYRQESNISPLSKPEPVHRNISRRTLVLVLGMAGLTVAGASAYYFWRAQTSSPVHNEVIAKSHSTLANEPTSAPTPTPLAIGTPIFTYHGHQNNVYSVQWSSNDKRIVSASEDTTAQVWNALDGGSPLIYRGHTTGLNEATWSPDDAMIASVASDPRVQVWNATNGSQIYTYPGQRVGVYTCTARWSPDGKRIASGGLDTTVQVWNALDGGNVYTYRGHSSVVNKVAWSPDGRRIVSGSEDTTVQVWDANDGGNALIYRGHKARVRMVAWSPDGKRIASVGGDNMVQVWNASNGSTIFVYTGHNASVTAAAWSPDGRRIASTSEDATVQVWDVVDGGKRYTYTGHKGMVLSVAWSHDGKYIASSGDYVDPTVQIWHA